MIEALEVSNGPREKILAARRTQAMKYHTPYFDEGSAVTPALANATGDCQHGNARAWEGELIDQRSDPDGQEPTYSPPGAPEAIVHVLRVRGMRVHVVRRVAPLIVVGIVECCTPLSLLALLLC
jgi:hypothetical protein